ncbi:porin family protein [Flavobacterium terrigena]|uniref:Outer membrane protein beta-barrel domain-containing protein n=1 Tax=Flavobacterium terrigena TaxID=402734 RepID=A0A1H6RYY8_9FLAO|nr:porin family protein [Flavobacterium terrigena]SEI57010.1 Outer membrane protein beta-barrel domain-containing protein [Flavobacterium terrigena]
MKNVILLLTSFISVTAFSQEEVKSSSDARFGIKGGLNYSTVTKGDFEEGLDPRTSFYIGFVSEIPLVGRILHLQPEMIYSRQGFESNYSFLGENYNDVYQVDYINIPVLLKLYAGNTLSFEFGPQFGLKVNEKIVRNDSEVEENDINSFDTALAGGVSLNFDKFFLSGRYTYSLNEIIKDSNSKNSVFQIGGGFRF